MENAIETLENLKSLIPVNLELTSMLKFIVFFAFMSLFLGLVGRVVFGSRSDLNLALTSSIGILLTYAVSIVIYTFNPRGLASYLPPLPYVIFGEETLYLYSFRNAPFNELCSQILSMILLALIVNVLNEKIPEGKKEDKKVVLWIGMRFLIVAVTLVLHSGITWAIDTYLPGPLTQYAPIVLLLMLAVMLLLAISKAFLGIVLTITNPIIGALYTFFFAKFLGKQLTKSVLSTLILTALVLLLHYLGYAAISITIASLIAYLPLILALMALWYLIGHGL